MQKTRYRNFHFIYTLIHLTKSSACLAHSRSLSVGRLFVPACIITCEGLVTEIGQQQLERPSKSSGQISPDQYDTSEHKRKKAYLAIFACSLSRAVHLELLRNMETDTIILCFKWYTARRGRPCVIHSDNGGTFVKTTK